MEIDFLYSSTDCLYPLIWP